jgi:hypothetical protein
MRNEVDMRDTGSVRAKRGFHRLGIVLATCLGLCALAVGIIVSLDNAASRRDRFIALQCADRKLQAKSDETSSAPANVTSKNEADLLPMGSTFVGPDGKTRLRIPEIVSLRELGCSSAISASRDEIAESRTIGFGYATTIATDLGLSALIAGVVALLGYISVGMISWIVRGFLRV